MKRMMLFFMVMALSISVGTISAAEAKKGNAVKSGKGPVEFKQKVGYAIGLNIGGSLRKDGIELDMSWLFKGIEDALREQTPQLSEAEIMTTMKLFQEEMQKKMMKKMAERTNLGRQSKIEGEKFLAANKKKPGVQTTASGLQYKVIKEGTGPKPTAKDEVTVHYRGTLLNGKEFDSSYKRNEPATFPVRGVIPGWTEVLQLMNTGSTWEVYIPSELAYGERGMGQDILPNSTLIFTVELISVKAGEDETMKNPEMEAPEANEPPPSTKKEFKKEPLKNK